MAITVTQLSAFLAVVRSGSVTAAADELAVTQPSVSSAVASLSRELGCELLERDGRGIQPTPAGRAFAAYASDVIGLLEAGRRAAREAAEQTAQDLRIAVTATAAETFVPALLQRYAEAHPEVTARLTVGGPQTILDAVIDHEIDLAVIGRAVHDPRLSSIPIRRNNLICVTSPSDAVATRKAVRGESLEDRVWLLREMGSSTRLASEQYLAERGLHPETLTLGSNAAIKQGVIAGLGVALLSAEVAEGDLARGALAEVQLRDGPPQQQWFIVHSVIGPVRPALKALIEFSQAESAAHA